MKYLLFFTALITTATALNLTCQCSMPVTAPACNETANNTCTITDGQCYSMQSQIATGKDEKVNVTSGGCSDVCNDNTAFFSTDGVFYLLSKAKCCKDKDGCNNGVAVVLPRISEIYQNISSKNLVCPSCFVLGKTICDGGQMKCKEGQTQCFTITGKITKGDAAAQEFIAKGCATSNSIFKSGATLNFGKDSYKLDKVEFVEAKSGVSQISSCLSFAILLPSVLWFLLDSSLY